MSWREVWLLYRHELRSALREQSIVVNSLLIPVLIYPLVLWVISTAVGLVQGQTEGMVSRVALVGLSVEHRALQSTLGDDRRFRLIRLPVQNPAPDSAPDPHTSSAEAPLPPSTVAGSDEPAAEDRLRDQAAASLIAGNRLDAVAELLASRPSARFPGNFRVRLVYDQSRARSRKAKERLVEVLGQYRARWLEEHARGLGISSSGWRQFRIETVNAASGRDMGAFLLGMIVPLFVIIVVAAGCFYPAVDTVAGERERSTWETLMSVSAARSSIVTAKYLYVATFGIVAGGLNLITMSLSLGPIAAPLIGGDPWSFSIAPATAPVIGLGIVLLALFVAAGMMILASFAHTFKEGQALTTPFYLLITLPLLFCQLPGLKLTAVTALLPVVNLTVMFREAMVGTCRWPLIGLTFLVQVATIAACLYLARMILSVEDLMLGSYRGSLAKFLVERFSPRSRYSGRFGRSNYSAYSGRSGGPKGSGHGSSAKGDNLSGGGP